MQTAARPSSTRPEPRLPFLVIAEVSMALGVILAVLGIYEITGLLGLGGGLALIFAASVPMILHPSSVGLDREFRRLLDD